VDIVLIRECKLHRVRTKLTELLEVKVIRPSKESRELKRGRGVQQRSEKEKANYGIF
jgi:hypothetical protein